MSMRKLLIVCGLFGLVLTGSVSAGDPVLDELRQLFLKNQRWLLSSCEEWRRMGVGDAAWLEKFLAGLKQNSTNSVNEYAFALSEAVNMAKEIHLVDRNTGYVRQRCVIEMLIVALRSTDTMSMRRSAYDRLTKDCYQEDLDYYTDDIIKALGTPPFSGTLYGKLRLDEATRKSLSTNAAAPEIVRARAGNEEMEKRYIDDFEREKDYTKKIGLARDLGYIGTKRCAMALARGLNTDVASEGEFDRTSARCEILEALGKIYQKETLFTKDLMYLLVDNKIFKRADYIKDVDAWVMREFGFHPWGEGRVWFQEHKPYPKD